MWLFSHPPCGGCGLKYRAGNLALDEPKSPSLRRVWVEMSEDATKLSGAGGHPPCGGCGLK